MANKELADYITKSLSEGYSIKEIRDSLLSIGWKTEDVDLAVNSALHLKARKTAGRVGGARKLPRPVRIFIKILATIIIVVALIYVVSSVFFTPVQPI